MEKREPVRPSSFIFDEQGQNEVSEQIMNSYNSGFIDQETALANRADYTDIDKQNLQ